jgi:hypothetical protein
MESFPCIIAAKGSAFDCVVFIILGAGTAVYGLLAKTFRESGRLRILTPTDELEKYVPRWYHRLLLIALGIGVMVGGISELWWR